MNNFNRLSIGCLIAVTSGMVNAEPPEWANAALTVANEVCEVNDPVSGVEAVGKSTLVLTSSGQINVHCNGIMLSDPPAQTTRATVPGPTYGTIATECKVVLTKSGQFVAACKEV